jgi:hypothetical protein
LFRSLLLAITVSVAAVSAAAIASASIEAKAADGLPIIDVHTHLFGGPRNLGFGRAVEVALSQLNGLGIRKALVMSPPRGSSIQSNFDYPQFVGLIKLTPY